MTTILTALRASVEDLPDTATAHDLVRVCNCAAKLCGGRFPERVQLAYDAARADALRAGSLAAATEKVLAFLATLPGGETEIPPDGDDREEDLAPPDVD